VAVGGGTNWTVVSVTNGPAEAAAENRGCAGHVRTA
jgi:hypothetical protein